jgi:putative cell wall-binding protein
MPIKAMDRSGEGLDYVVADGIVWAVDHGAQIINLSLGGQDESDVLKSAVDYAQENGILVVAAAGNHDDDDSDDNGKSISFPASEPGVIAVTATDKNDKVPSFSVTGPEAGLAAPGEDIISDYWQKRSGYASVTGTSMAAPFISGVAALVWGLHPELTAEQVKTVLEDSALDLGTPGRDSDYGYGRVNAYWAVRFAGEAEPLPSPANMGWAGGIIQFKGQEASQIEALLGVPQRAFGMDQKKEVQVTLSSAQSVADLPPEIIPAGTGILVEWNSPSQKLLNLSVSITSEGIAALEGQISGEQRLAYLYRWSGTRWIEIGGGVKAVELKAGQEVRAGISEPGIYRVGLEPVPVDTRIAGADRIQTAVQIAQANFATGADTVLLARADDFPDALAGAPLAYKYHAPILLTEVSGLPDSVRDELLRLNPQKIILLGGTGAISANVEAQVRALASVQRIGGANRYATAARIAEELGMVGEAVVVNGNNYADAITMAAIAAEYGVPILLSEKNTLPAETSEILRKYSVSKSEVIGGEGVVSNKVLKGLPTSVRLSGKDRYSTAAAVLTWFPPEGNMVYLATGENFPDALTGGVVAAMNNSRIVLVSPSGLSAAQEAALVPWSGLSTMVLGGRAVVSDEVVSQVSALVKE